MIGWVNTLLQKKIHQFCWKCFRIRAHEEQRKQEEKRRQEEGEEIKRVAIADRLEREKLEQIYKDKMKNLLADYRSQMEGHNKMKEIERLREEVHRISNFTICIVVLVYFIKILWLRMFNLVRHYLNPKTAYLIPIENS